MLATWQGVDCELWSAAAVATRNSQFGPVRRGIGPKFLVWK